MKNIYGEKLNRYGDAPSILNETDDKCFLCDKGGDLIRHEVFYGIQNRDRSKELGVWINLCPACHNKIHNGDKDIERELKAIAQERTMEYYGWSTKEFRQHFGKSWI